MTHWWQWAAAGVFGLIVLWSVGEFFVTVFRAFRGKR